MRKAYEGELVAVGEEEWIFQWGTIPEIARGKFLSQVLGSRLMDPQERTGMPPFCAINGVFTPFIFLFLDVLTILMLLLVYCGCRRCASTVRQAC